MALTRSLVTIGMPERLAQALGTHWQTLTTGAQNAVTLTEPLVFGVVASAANNYLHLPIIEQSKTAFHVVYNTDTVNTLRVMPTSGERLFGSATAPAMTITPERAAVFWGGVDTGVVIPTSADWCWIGILSA